MLTVQTAFFFFAILMLVLTLAQKHLIPSLLMAGIVVNRLCYQLDIPSLCVASPYIEMALCLFALVYAGFPPGQLNGIRLALAIVSAFWFVHLIVATLHWPYANEIRLSMAIPVLVYFVSQFRSNLRIEPQSGILTFWAASEMYILGKFILDNWL